MKKFFLIAAASIVALGVAAPASATTLNLDLSLVSTTQQQAGANQSAVSLAGNVGPVMNSNTVASTAANIGQNAVQDIGLDQNNGGLVNGAGLLSAVSQSEGMVNQAAASVAGTGPAGNYNSVTGMAANLGQNAQTTVRITQH